MRGHDGCGLGGYLMIGIYEMGYRRVPSNIMHFSGRVRALHSLELVRLTLPDG